MILNTGSRTDIPAYYSNWFYNRIREGFVLVRNPYYPEQISRYELDPKVVDGLVFCTKNPQPMLNGMEALDPFRQFWFVTITPYGREIEPYVPDREQVMEAFCKLSEKVGKKAVSWRYDPVFISEKYSVEYHIRIFEEMAKKLAGATESCVISFIDLYAKTRKNFPQVRKVTEREQRTLAKAFADTGKKYGMTIRSCAEGTWMEEFGIDVSGCMTKEILERALECNLKVPARRSVRAEGENTCNCLLGNDIGQYNTCGHGCLYCYANYDRKTVEQNMRLHDPDSALLTGQLAPGEVVHEAKQESWIDPQMRFDFLY